MQPDFLCLWLLLLTAAPQETPTELPGLHNLNRASETVFLGSEPHGEEAFASLSQLGIGTIISVDGAIPNVERAKRYGIRCIHIPFGYDGIPGDAASSLARVAREITSPMYVHCHHGRHRGPAAAAIVCMAGGSMDHMQAVQLMARAGTSKDYTGLWRDVMSFSPPDPHDKFPELVEVAEVDSVTAAMARLDRSFDNLKLAAASEWITPDNHPDLVPSSEALLVQEGLHETSRLLTSHHDEQFREWLNETESLAAALCAALKAKDAAIASVRLKAVERACSRCHLEYRDR